MKLRFYNGKVLTMEEGKEVGYTFTEDMPVVFEEFEVIEVF